MNRRWFQFRLRTLLIVVTIIPIVICICDRVVVRIGDGWLDVEMRYQVVDADTGQPIAGATVDFRDEDRLPVKWNEAKLSLTTDADGVATRIAHHAGCTWRTSMLGFTSTFFAGAVSWALRCSAVGYRPTGWFCPNTVDYDWRSKYLGHGKARATIRIPLHKAGEGKLGI